MNHLYTFLALDLANERRERRVSSAIARTLVARDSPCSRLRPDRIGPSFARRALAQGLAAVSRGSAAACASSTTRSPTTSAAASKTAES